MPLVSEIDLQVFHAWRRRVLKKDSGSPRIAVVGNCQSFGIAYGMKLLNPDSTVHRFTIACRAWTNLDMLERTLRDYDHVFSLEFQKSFIKGGDWLALRDRMPSVIPIPSIVFSGFHPDTIYILDPTRDGLPLDGATGPYHSALALYGYLAGLTPERTIGLFNANVYRMLGYFDIWQPAADEFLAASRATGPPRCSNTSRVSVSEVGTPRGLSRMRPATSCGCWAAQIRATQASAGGANENRADDVQDVAEGRDVIGPLPPRPGCR